MRDSTFVTDTCLPELGRGAGLAIWGFRACAIGGAGCCTIVRGFERAFGDETGPPLLGNLLALARFIGHDGRRKVSLAVPGCVRITRDELSLLTVFAASQMQDEALRDAHLTWLTACSPDETLTGLADQIAMSFAHHGYDIHLPQTSGARPVQMARPGTLYALEGGRA
ncbi:hypothetical protein [Henriciella aquimarina]|uniref:hypothetical protein n=1 Tax=Henriciella aquimarina TaxID=545261 RepID=UPI0009FBC1DF|nr:hypothetical protein [Henriciella aquimarina]